MVRVKLQPELSGGGRIVIALEEVGRGADDVEKDSANDENEGDEEERAWTCERLEPAPLRPPPIGIVIFWRILERETEGGREGGRERERKRERAGQTDKHRHLLHLLLSSTHTGSHDGLIIIGTSSSWSSEHHRARRHPPRREAARRCSPTRPPCTPGTSVWCREASGLGKEEGGDASGVIRQEGGTGRKEDGDSRIL
eukprot:886054-Rhodomonas_salina.2